jgi:Flp pilus assembly protein TadG
MSSGSTGDRDGSDARISQALSRFRQDQRGAALVEFAMVLPIMLIFFATTVEGARMMWSYQAATSAVRDASRYLAMVAPIDACTSATAVTGYTDDLEEIVMVSISGATIYPGDITINSVTPSCAGHPYGPAFRRGRSHRQHHDRLPVHPHLHPGRQQPPAGLHGDGQRPAPGLRHMNWRKIITRRLRELGKDDSGTTLVEFAIVFVIFLVVMFALVDFGRLAYRFVVADKAMQIASRVATVRPAACPGVPESYSRGGSTAEPPYRFGTSCNADSGICNNPGTITCSGDASNATAVEVWNRIQPLMPLDAISTTCGSATTSTRTSASSAAPTRRSSRSSFRISISGSSIRSAA